MKNITSNYKQNVKLFGRQIDSKITYELDGETVELGAEELNSITPIYESQILKSVMKQLDIDSNVEIPIGTILTYQFGVKVGNSYEYTNYGNYIVKTIEKQEDLRSWKITCYDKMLYAMTDYESVGVTYPITIRNYINAIATHLNLTFKNVNDVFANYDKEIQNELYLDENGGSLGYTFRDVLDELAQVTASTICINEEDDELEIRYINELVNETSTATGTKLNINNKYASSKIDLELDGNTEQDRTPTPSNPVPINVVSGRQNIVVAGKNLFSLENIVNNGTGRTTYEIDGNNIVITATSSGTYRYIYKQIDNLTIGQEYTIKIGSHNDTSTNKIAQWGVVNSGGSYYGYVRTLSSVQQLTFTPTETSVVFRAGYLGNSCSQGDILTIGNIQLEKGNQATTYEAYNGTDYEINLGKQLLDLKDGTYTVYGTDEVTGIVKNGELSITCNTTANRFLTINLNTKLNLEIGTSYTTSMNNEVANSNLRFRIEDSGTFDTILSSINATKTFTYASSILYGNSIKIRIASGTTLTNFKIKPMLELGQIPTSYSPYKTPIELNKIGNYKDKIFRSSGKNLFDKDNANILLALVDSTTLSSRASYRTLYIPITGGETYTISKISSTRFRVATTITTPEFNISVDNYIQNDNATSITITTSSTANYLCVCYHITTETLTEQEILDSIQIEKGSVASEFEPYSQKGKWYIYKKIGKVVLDGSETMSVAKTGTANWYYDITKPTGINADSTPSQNNAMCDYYPISAVGNSNTNQGIYVVKDSGKIRIRYGTEDTITNFKNWLSTHNTTVYYVLETPTVTEIIDLELIEQLNAVKLMTGTNNVTVSSSNLASPLKLTYATNCEEIDEEYLKDINVNFGEKFGPVNSIVLSRASESDNVYLRNEISVENDGLCEIKIKDNQIMNFNDRSNYLPDILDKLYGLEYYINDFNSTGITYLDLCDKYYAKVFDNRYPCIMFNDEVDITQGLQETIHTEMPEESETDYKKADKTDRRINQAYIIVNKQEQTIEALTSSVETISQTENNNYLELLNKFQSLDENIADITEIENAVRQLQTNTYTKTEIQEIANGTAQDGTKVSTVITTSGTFDKDGLTIEQTTADTKTNINADGMIIYNKTGSTDDTLLTVNSNGVITKNLKVETYTEIGKNSRFEDFVTDDYEDATAVFWIGS